jgi:hypothetical protein
MVALSSGEVALHRIQVSPPEGTRGTPETTTILLPAAPEAIITLDRGFASPDEDYGIVAQNQPDRGIYGVRLATLPFRSVGLYETIGIHLGCSIEGGVAATNPAVGVDLFTFVRDMDGDSLDTRTFQEGDNEAVYQMAYAMARQLRL